jgi:hypothetical protein
MKKHVFRGSKQEIAESIAKRSGEVREAIVLEEESAPSGAASHLRAQSIPGEKHDIDRQ